jgi:hypothetical protein
MNNMNVVKDNSPPASDAAPAGAGSVSSDAKVTAQKPVMDFMSEPSSSLKMSADTGERAASADGTKSPVLLAVEVEIPKVHSLGKQSKVDMVFNATKCGLLFSVAKAEVKTGTFENWFKKQKFGFTKVTRCKYASLAEHICAESKSKPSLLLKVRSLDHASVTFEFDESRLKSIIEKVCSERSLTKLYVDWGICQRSSDADQSRTLKAESTVRRWKNIVENLPKVFPSLSPEVQNVVVLQLENLLKQLKTSSQTRPE